MIGRVYKLSSGDLVYFGSTVSSLDTRKTQHLYNARNLHNRCSQPLFENSQIVNIECLEEFEVSGPLAENLRVREQWYIANHPCINNRRAYRSKQDIAEKNAAYYKNNKDKWQGYYLARKQLRAHQVKIASIERSPTYIT